MGTMSKEEILKILEDAKDKNSDVPMRLVRQAFEKLPEPCEDAVSRQAAIDALTEYGNGRAVYIGVEEAVRRIEQLPSAQPERKTGKWNEYYRMHYRDTFSCNRCGSCFIVLQGADKMNLCPNCGADMRGEQNESD